MEVYSKEFLLGNLNIELSVQENHGINRVIVTAKDEENRRIWRTPVLHKGEIKTYRSQEAAIKDAEKKLSAVDKRKKRACLK